jgi:hypothetical protein
MGLIDTLGWVVLAGAVECELALVAPRLKRIVGLIERFFTASVIVWLASSPLNSYVSASAALPLRYGATPKPFHRQTAGHPSSIQSLSDAWWGTQRLSSESRRRVAGHATLPLPLPLPSPLPLTRYNG